MTESHKCMFNFIKNCQAVFRMAIPFCILTSNVWEFQLLRILAITLFSVLKLLKIIAMVVSVKWHIIVILICISLMADDVKNLFLCLFAIMLSSFMKCLFISSFYFLIGFVFFSSFLPPISFIFWPCCVTCEISVPQPGIEPMKRKHQMLTTRPPGNSHGLFSYKDLRVICIFWI